MVTQGVSHSGVNQLGLLDDGCDEVNLLVLSVCLFVPGMSNGDDGDFGGSKLIVTSLWYGFRSTLFLDNILPF